jgi:ketosteroid isomerase-like protein
MSENLDLVRSIFADWERGDFSRSDWAAPEIEYVIGPDAPWPVSRTGLAGMAEGEREFLSTFENMRIAADEYRELDDERVLVFHRASGRGKTSGLPIAQVSGGGVSLFHVRERKVTRFVGYFDRDRALADLGLEGLAMPEESTTAHLAELLRRLVDIVNRRAWGELADVFARDGVLDLSDLGLGAYEGDAIRAFGEDWVGAYDKYEMVMDEVLELDNGVVFTVNHQVARPTGSSGDVRLHDAYVFICEDSRIVRWTAYQSIDEARAAAERLARERG